MDSVACSLNALIVNIYNNISKIESEAFNTGKFKDVSITEVHTVAAIGMYGTKTMSETARGLKITMGTLTVAINNLVKKGYVQRFRCETDKRVVRVGLTKKGRLLYRVHAEFHINVIKKCTDNLDNDEILTLYKALEKLDRFIKGEYFGCSKNDSEK